MSQSEGPRTAEAAAESARRTAEAMGEATRESMEKSSQLTRELIERNSELAMQVAPVVFEGYERALRSFAALYEQAGQQMSQVTSAVGGTSAQVAESMTKAAQSLSQIPAQVGQSMAEAGQSASQVAQQSVGQGDLPQSVAALATAQATFMRDVAETLSMARELIEKEGVGRSSAGAEGGAGSSS
jgi:hypothetical protein